MEQSILERNFSPTSPRPEKNSGSTVTKYLSADINLNLDGAFITTNDETSIDTFYREILQPAGTRLQRLLEEEED